MGVVGGDATIIVVLVTDDVLDDAGRNPGVLEGRECREDPNRDGTPNRWALTPEYLALLAAEYRARGDEPERVYKMAEERRINRSTLWRHIQKAKEQGFL